MANGTARSVMSHHQASGDWSIQNFLELLFFCSSWGEFGRLSKTKTDVGKSQNFLAEKSFEQIELGEFGQISPLSEKNGKKEFFVKYKFYSY